MYWPKPEYTVPEGLIFCKKPLVSAAIRIVSPHFDQ